MAERPLVGFDLSITRCMGSSGDRFWGLLLAQTVATELQTASVVNDPIEDGVGEGRVADQVMPGTLCDGIPAVNRLFAAGQPSRSKLSAKSGASALTRVEFGKKRSAGC